MGIVALAIGLDARCSPQYVPSVAKKPKYRSSLAKAGRCIVAIATTRLDRADNAGLTIGYTWAGDTWPMYAVRMGITQFKEVSI